jgi:hypothetical protein
MALVPCGLPLFQFGSTTMTFFNALSELAYGLKLGFRSTISDRHDHVSAITQARVARPKTR